MPPTTPPLRPCRSYRSHAPPRRRSSRPRQPCTRSGAPLPGPDPYSSTTHHGGDPRRWPGNHTTTPQQVSLHHAANGPFAAGRGPRPPPPSCQGGHTVKSGTCDTRNSEFGLVCACSHNCFDAVACFRAVTLKVDFKK